MDAERPPRRLGRGEHHRGDQLSWLEGGFFLQQDAEIGAFSSFVYSNLSPVPLPYKWDLQGDTLTISVSHGPLDASFSGEFSDDGESFSGGWRPNSGADETVNISYDVAGSRVKWAESGTYAVAESAQTRRTQVLTRIGVRHRSARHSGAGPTQSPLILVTLRL